MHLKNPQKPGYFLINNHPSRPSKERSFIRSGKWLSSTQYAPGTVPGARGILGNRTDGDPYPHGTRILVEGRSDGGKCHCLQRLNNNSDNYNFPDNFREPVASVIITRVYGAPTLCEVYSSSASHCLVSSG